MDPYCNTMFGRQDPGIKRVVTAKAGPFTSLQLPVTIYNEQYKAVVDVGLPTSLISTAIWQKVSSPLYPITDNEITERVARRTNLPLMGFTRFELQVGSTLLQLDEALVYDYDEPEIFLNISAIAALGLVVDFQEGTFGLRSEEGLRCNWNDDTLLFPDSKLGNVSLLHKQNSSDSYFDSLGSRGDSGIPSNASPYRAAGNVMGQIDPNLVGSFPCGPEGIPIGVQEMASMGYNQIGPSSMNIGPMGPHYVGPPHADTIVRRAVNFKKLKNFRFKSPSNSTGGYIDEFTNMKFTEIANWKSATNVRKEKKNKPAKNSPQSNTKQSMHSSGSQKKAGNFKNKNVSKRNSISPARQAKHVQNAGNKNQNTNKKVQCFNCKSRDHSIDQCNKPIVLKCVYCGRNGHLRTSCPTVMKTSNPGSASMLDTLHSSDAMAGAAETAVSKRPAVSPEKVVVKKLVVQRGSGDANTMNGKKTVIKRVVIKKKIIKPFTTGAATDTSKVVTVGSAAGSGTGSSVSEPALKNDSSENNREAEKINIKVPEKITSDLLSELDDSFKKPELDLVFEPVKRVVAKKNIKLNMISKPTANAPEVSKSTNDSGSENSHIPASDPTAISQSSDAPEV